MEQTSVAPSTSDHPIRLRVTDDLQRNRLTGFFRLILAIPHIFWVILWGVITLLAWIVNWFATLIMGRSPNGLHTFLAGYLRYFTHVRAYMFLLADPFPGFGGKAGYPIELEVARREPQNRQTVIFRGILAILAPF